MRRLAQFRDAINGKARTFQFQSRTRLSSGGNKFLQTKAGFEDFVLTLLLGMDVVGGLICIGQGFVVVDLITKITLGIRQVIAIPRLTAVQLAALGYGGILVFVDVVGVLAALDGKAAVFSGAFQFLV